MNYIPVPVALRASNINGYSDSGQAAKDAFHKHGKVFLRKVAEALGVTDYDLRSNVAGIAVSGEVTLHSDDIYLQLSESCTRPGVDLMVRSCASRKDYCGYTNNFVHMKDFGDSDQQTSVMSRFAQLLQSERTRKQVALQATPQLATA